MFIAIADGAMLESLRLEATGRSDFCQFPNLFFGEEKSRAIHSLHDAVVHLGMLSVVVGNIDHGDAYSILISCFSFNSLII